MKYVLLAAVALLGLTLVSPGGTDATMPWVDLISRPKPQPDAQMSYGADALQHVDIWLPKTAGKHPVVLMVHGGCWQTHIADATLMNYIAGDLRARGIAVWNIEYRGIDRPGGGYPGIFLDAAAAADALAANATRYDLDIANVVAFGHSAGGHLALWLAARERIPADSTLHAKAPLKIATAISVGGLPDLEAAQRAPGDTCGVEAVHLLTGTPSEGRPNVYRDTSPAELMPFATHQVLVNASLDRIAPPSFADAYERRAKARHVVLRRVVIPGEGHVELIAPGSAAWAAEVREIQRALHLPVETSK
ncbi:Alpha/beta hydrolase [Sphingomonas antarctica]|uniref:alpha/beta hydrolase family protein n=1 Tax=Sphingomonas antarctica TaxID=2040274 RepID=UPI0039ED04CC